MHGFAAMWRTVRATARLFWQALYRFFGSGLPGRAAGLAFYTVFSMPALLTLLLLIVGRFADAAAAQAAIIAQVADLVGPAGALQVGAVLTHARSVEASFSGTAALSLLALGFGATAAFAQLQGALNDAWGVKADPSRSQVKVFLVKRVFSFGLVLAVAFFLMVSLAVSTALASAGSAIAARLPAEISGSVLQAANAAVAFAVAVGLFAAMLRYLPDARTAWRDVLFGAVATALLFAVGKAVIGGYLGSTDPGTAYGAAGSLAIVLIWIYYTSMVVLYGAELTRVWTEAYGGGVRPQPGAVAVVQEERTVARGRG